MPDQFRVEWGPIFHRGRLDGSARVVVIGQDPAQTQTVVRRVLVGEAGRRLQGLLAKLGITKSYAIVNTFLYSVYGNVKAATARDARLIQYRNAWLDALLIGKEVEGVIALGDAAEAAWLAWKKTDRGKTFDVAVAALTHPTQPESSSNGDQKKLADATRKLLENWNTGLQTLSAAIQHPDVARPLVPYGKTWEASERPAIPEFDMPPGLPGLDAPAGWVGGAPRERSQSKAPQHHDQCPDGRCRLSCFSQRFKQETDDAAGESCSP